MKKKEEVKIVVPPISQPIFKFGLGWMLKDITGVEGFVFYRVDNMTGCNQYGIQCMSKDAGGKPESHMYDESRLTFTGEVVELPVQPKDEPAMRPGGLNNPIAQARVK